MVTKAEPNENEMGLHDPEATFLTKLNEFNQRIMVSETVQQAVELTLSYVLETIQAQAAVILLFDEKGEIYFRYTQNKGEESLRGDLEAVGQILIQRVRLSGEPIFVSKKQMDDAESLSQKLQEQGVQSLLCIPFRLGNATPIGSLFVCNAMEHDFASFEMARISQIAAHASGIFQYLRLLSESRKREKELAMMVDTSHLLISTLEPEDLFQQIAVRLAWVTGMDSCAISTYERDPDRVQLLAQYTSLGERSPKDVVREVYLLSEYPATRQVLEKNEPLYIRADDPKADASEVALLRLENMQSLLMLPLWAKGQPLGLVEIYGVRSEQVFKDSDIKRLMVFSEQVALAVTNARLYQSERKSRTLAEALSEVSLALASSLKLGELLDLILAQIGRVVPYDSASVILVEDGVGRVARHRGFERFGTAEQATNYCFDIQSTPSLKQMAETHQPYLIPDVSADPGWLVTPASQHIRSSLGTPLVVRDRLLGFITLDNVQKGFYTNEHAHNLGIFARHAAVAVMNAMTYGEVEQASITDFLTGAYNHRYFYQQLQVELERATRSSYPLSLLMIDLDLFKNVNDQHGHLCGDQVLRLVAGRFKTALRATDLLARYGGEEFTVILPGTPLSGGIQVAERVRTVISEQPVVVGRLSIPITVSVGVAVFPDDAQQGTELVSQADKAMYLAKAGGRNRVCALK